jgi:hypothetical protein
VATADDLEGSFWLEGVLGAIDQVKDLWDMRPEEILLRRFAVETFDTSLQAREELIFAFQDVFLCQPLCSGQCDITPDGLPVAADS